MARDTRTANVMKKATSAACAVMLAASAAAPTAAYAATSQTGYTAAKVSTTTISTPVASVSKSTSSSSLPLWQRISVTEATVYAPDATYTGKPIEIHPTVIVNSKILVEGRDYTLCYTPRAEPGTCFYLVQGIGLYKNSYLARIKIVDPLAPAQPTDIHFTDVEGLDDQIYKSSGTPIPYMKIRRGTKTLTEGVDYDVRFERSNIVGTANVVITGKGDYCGTRTLHYSIRKSVSDLTVSRPYLQYATGYAVTPTITVKDGYVTLRKGTDYTLSYSNNVKPGTASVTVTGMGNYTGKLTRNFTIMTTPLSLTTVSSIAAQTYTGRAIKPTVRVSYAGNYLRQGTDYTVSYSNNVYAGTARVTVYGRGCFSGSCTKTFTIKSPAPKYKVGFDTTAAKKAFNAYNSFRKSKGLKAVTWDSTCLKFAQDCAKKNAQRSGFTLTHRLGIPKAYQTSYSDILACSSCPKTANELINMWKNSKGHRRQMQCNTATRAALAAYQRADGSYFYAIVYNFRGTNQSGS